LMRTIPGVAGAGAGEPDTAGGMEGAQPCVDPLALTGETRTINMLQQSKTATNTAAKYRTEPPLNDYYG
jgi:hypothetical protein